MLAKLVDILFGCPHTHRTFPITPTAKMRVSRAAQQTGTYVVCLDCGAELAYDWERMKVNINARVAVVSRDNGASCGLPTARSRTGAQGTFAVGSNPMGAITGSYVDANNMSHGFVWNSRTRATACRRGLSA